MVYVFCGVHEYLCQNRIEAISENSLVPGSKIRWKIVEVPQNILIPRKLFAVAPLNDTEIAILGGWTDDGSLLNDVVLLDTKTLL